MRLPLWLRDRIAAQRVRADQLAWRQQRAARYPALRAVELEERRVLAVTAIDAAANITGVTEGQALANITVATFTDPDPNNLHTATIDWGDGTPTSAGTIQANGNGQYTVTGSHTYDDNKVYNVLVTVKGQENVPFSDQLTITVGNADPTLTVPGNNSIINPQTNQPYNEGQQIPFVSLGLFQDAGKNDTHGVTVDWGDGKTETIPVGGQNSSTLALSELNGSGKVQALHTYTDNGVFNPNTGQYERTIKVTVFDDDGGSVTKSFTIAVNNVDPTLTVPADNSIINPQTNQPYTEGQQIPFASLGLFQDAGESDTHGATVDWGDGNTETIAAGGPNSSTLAVSELNGSGKVQAFHTYTDNGVFNPNTGQYERTIKVTVFDDDGGSVTKQFTIVVNNANPTLTVPADNSVINPQTNQPYTEGQQIPFASLGLFQDLGTSDTHGVTVDWGDGNTETIPVGGPNSSTLALSETNGSGKVQGFHTYTDNGVFNPNTGQFERTIKVTVFDDDGGSVTKQFTIVVNNANPTLTVPADNSIVNPQTNQPYTEGQQIPFANLGLFEDLGTSDTHGVTVDWGDGNTETIPLGGPNTSTLALSETNGSGKVQGFHTYTDNGVFNPNTGQYERTIKVTVFDDDGGSVTKSFTIIVNNANPTLTVPADNSIVNPQTNQPYTEGQQIPFANLGLFEDLGTSDTHGVTVDWGDGSPTETIPVGGPNTSTLALSETNGSGKVQGFHTYTDNGVFNPNTGQYERTIKVTVFDDDGGSVTKSFTIVVINVDPTLTVPADNSLLNPQTNQPYIEGQQVIIPNLGSFADLGTSDTHGVTVDWGDGNTETIGVGQAGTATLGLSEVNGAGTIQGAHTYTDNGTFNPNTGQFERTIKVTVPDDDGGTVTKTFTIVVNNANPVLTSLGNQSVAEDKALSLASLGSFTDAGTADTHTAQINWGDGSPPETVLVQQGAGSGTLGGAQHTYLNPGVYVVSVTVTDDDLGPNVQTFSVNVSAVVIPPVIPPDRPVILPPTGINDPPAAPPGANALLPNDQGGASALFSSASLYQPTDARDDLASTNALRDDGAGALSVTAAEKRFILVIVFADGTESEPVTVPDADVSNFPGLWRRLPDNFYRVYQVQENGSLRLVTEGYVQGGQLVDPNDKNETQDRPPTSQQDPAPGSPVVARNLNPSVPAAVISTANLSQQQFAEPALELALPAAEESVPAAAAELSEAAVPEDVTADSDAPSSLSPWFVTAALSATALINRGAQPDWEQKLDRALEELPEDWSRRKSRWRARRPR